MLLRRFNKAGIQEFHRLLSEIREDPKMGIPKKFLDDAEYSDLVSPEIEIEQRYFTKRREAAEYLQEILSPLEDSTIVVDAGLWTWLTLFYFDEICPAKNDKRNVKNDYYYIFEPKNPRHYYRHLLFIGWRILSLSPVHNRLFLDVLLKSLDGATTEVMKRLYLTRIKCIFEILDRIYWNDDTNRIRKGIIDSSKITAGDLIHRFPLRIRQLEMTYDLQSLNADQLLEMLGDEFIFDKKSLENNRNVKSPRAPNQV